MRYRIPIPKPRQQARYWNLEGLILASATAWVWAGKAPADKAADEVLSP